MEEEKVAGLYITGIEDKIKKFMLDIFEKENVTIHVKYLMNNSYSILADNGGNLKLGTWKYYFDFKLTQMPGNCGILISHNMNTNPDLRGKGLGQFLQQIKEEIARLNNYSQLYCTTVSDNLPEIHILEKFGWKKVNTFVNQRTGHTCFEWVKEIKHA